jgi:hypothetical protein
MAITAQMHWGVPNVIGHSRDQSTGEIDHTEGFGAFDSILKTYSLGMRTIDIGGGKYDYAKAYLSHRFGIDQTVYDPFMRSSEENLRALKEARTHPFDSCTSISVLNVIDTFEARKEHLKLCYDVLKEEGKAFFKIWPGDGSGVPAYSKLCFQSNQGPEYYIDEIEAVFGSHVVYDETNKLIRSTKRSI